MAMTVHPVAGKVGARVQGMDLADDLSGEEVSALRSALLDHRVLFFSDQQLTHASHVVLGRHFGELTRRSRPQNGQELDQFPEVLTISPQIDIDRYGRDNEAHFRQRWVSPPHSSFRCVRVAWCGSGSASLVIGVLMSLTVCLLTRTCKKPSSARHPTVLTCQAAACWGVVWPAQAVASS